MSGPKKAARQRTSTLLVTHRSWERECSTVASGVRQCDWGEKRWVSFPNESRASSLLMKARGPRVMMSPRAEQPLTFQAKPTPCPACRSVAGSFERGLRSRMETLHALFSRKFPTATDMLPSMSTSTKIADGSKYRLITPRERLWRTATEISAY